MISRQYDVGYLDLGSVDLEDGFADGQGAVVPEDQEVEHQVQDAVVEVHVGQDQGAADEGHDELELFVLLFVLILGLFVQNGDVDAAQDDFEVTARLTWQIILHLGQLSFPAQDVLLEVVLGVLLLLSGLGLVHVGQQLLDGAETVALVLHPADAFLLKPENFIQFGPIFLIKLLKILKNKTT